MFDLESPCARTPSPLPSSEHLIRKASNLFCSWCASTGTMQNLSELPSSQAKLATEISHLVEPNICSLLAECLSRHVESVLANHTGLLLVASDAAITLNNQLSSTSFLAFTTSQLIPSALINSPASGSFSVGAWARVENGVVRHDGGRSVVLNASLMIKGKNFAILRWCARWSIKVGRLRFCHPGSEPRDFVQGRILHCAQ